MFWTEHLIINIYVIFVIVFCQLYVLVKVICAWLTFWHSSPLYRLFLRHLSKSFLTAFDVLQVTIILCLWFRWRQTNTFGAFQVLVRHRHRYPFATPLFLAFRNVFCRQERIYTETRRNARDSPHNRFRRVALILRNGSPRHLPVGDCHGINAYVIIINGRFWNEHGVCCWCSNVRISVGPMVKGGGGFLWNFFEWG